MSRKAARHRAEVVIRTAPLQPHKEAIMAVKPIPEGYHTFTPYFVVEGASDFIDFLKKAFGGNEVYRFPAPGRKIGHAEVRVGDSVLMLADTSPEYSATRIGSYLYVSQ
jgi:hypothetical protein